MENYSMQFLCGQLIKKYLDWMGDYTLFLDHYCSLKASPTLVLGKNIASHNFNVGLKTESTRLL